MFRPIETLPFFLFSLALVIKKNELFDPLKKIALICYRDLIDEVKTLKKPQSSLRLFD
jgi:hypothetical protein